ncbi:hypothetical protein [Nannocystis sp.]|uniref:hypothetical protein n=1 Tax=Nannocystis sp. TaxID=1962667 RepID=UPI0025CD637B|nr:hypothetical protein [Nannocystis sp.]MBK7825159.1 hypothetical protein [Nannocystis sp.]
MHRPAPLLLALAACHPAPAHDLPICPVLVTAARATEADSRVLPPDLWFALLAPGFERSTGTPASDPRDCSQRPLLAADEPTLPARSRTPDDLSFGTSSDGALLVWARLVDYPDGSARGPVVLARWVAQGLEIRGVGSLRAPARRVRLHLERLADGHPLLIAEGESCPSSTTWPSGQATSCAREAVLLPLVDQRFLAADIIEGREPPRPARLRLDDRRELPRPGGGVRRIEVRRRIDLRAAPALHAAIRIRDCSPAAACDDHLTLVDARPLELSGLTFVTAEDPWQQLLAQQTTP